MNSHIFQAVPRESHLFNFIIQINKLISLPKMPNDMRTTVQNVCLMPKEECAVCPNSFIKAIYFDAKAVGAPFIFVTMNQKISMVALGSIK